MLKSSSLSVVLVFAPQFVFLLSCALSPYLLVFLGLELIVIVELSDGLMSLHFFEKDCSRNFSFFGRRRAIVLIN